MQRRDLYTIVIFQTSTMGILVSMMLWISSGLHIEMESIHSKMIQIHTAFTSEHARQTARQDTLSARMDGVYNLIHSKQAQ